MIHDTIGPFTVGEKPVPLEYRYLDEDGDPIDLTDPGYQARFQWGTSNFGTSYANAVTAPAVITNPADGRVTYFWDGSEFLAPGRYAGMFFVGNGVNRFASVLIVWTTCLSVDVPPTI